MAQDEIKRFVKITDPNVNQDEWTVMVAYWARSGKPIIIDGMSWPAPSRSPYLKSVVETYEKNRAIMDAKK